MFTTPKSPKFATTIFMLDATDVFVRDVLQKSIFALPCCMGGIFCLLFMQHGSAIFAVCNTSRARRRFFSFFQHLPSENHQNEKNRTAKPCCGGVSAKGATSKIGSKSASCPGIYDRDTFFNFTKKLTNRFNNVCNPPRNINDYDFRTLSKFHTISHNFTSQIHKTSRIKTISAISSILFFFQI